MKKFFAVLALCVLALALSALCVGAAEQAAKFEIVTLLDLEAQETTAVLANAEGKLLNDVDPEFVAKYFPDGKITGTIMAFLARIGGNEILFDAGLPDGHVAAELAKNNIKPEELKIILMTHLHPDHFGGLVMPDGTASFPNAQLYVSKIERDYWVNEVKDKDVIYALEQYKGRVHVFDINENAADFDKFNEVMPGVKAINTSGHTPGHVSYMLEQSGEKLLIIGDLMHFPTIQLPNPEVAVVFDVDPAKAIQTRKKVFDYVSENNIKIAGMHLPLPGFLKIKKAYGER
ncbi:MAG: MBL fold metallo-hydrolase [Synergistaceae bacterium]|nr:MBL fold metallo-hydrolase [Synergistaceae bacterium]